MGESSSHAALGKKVLARSKEGRYLRPRTIRQKEYVESIENFDLTFAIGPAGTGKTFLATVCAARLLNEKKIERPSIAIGKAKLEKEKLAKAKTQVEENESSKAESDSNEAES